MRAISLWQPWASAVVLGFKKFETRGKLTHCRGPLLIHAARTRDHVMFMRRTGIKEVFENHGITETSQLPLGAIIGVVNLDGCRKVEEVKDEISALEFALGDYSDGRFAWPLSFPVRFDTPIPFKAGQFFFNVPDSLLPPLTQLATHE
jgi:hypothetical protein